MATEFKVLGRRLRDIYTEATVEDGPSEDEVSEAFTTLARTWSHVAGSVGNALQNPEVREQLKQAASSLATAIGLTITDLGEELGRSEEE